MFFKRYEARGRGIISNSSFEIISLPPLMYIRKRTKEINKYSFNTGKILCQPANTINTIKKRPRVMAQHLKQYLPQTQLVLLCSAKT